MASSERFKSFEATICGIMGSGDYIKLLRPYQWYKNLLVFLPIVFGSQLFNLGALGLTVLGFIALCLVSSANYIINDIVDRKRDAHHPLNNKPIAKGIIPVELAGIIAALLFIVGIWISFTINDIFLLFVLILFVLGQLYNLAIKHEPILDVLVISTNFVLRAAAGAFVIIAHGSPYIWVSPWLIICTFLLALFLAVGKRTSELIHLENAATKFRGSLHSYGPHMTNALMMIATSTLIMGYALYSFLSVHQFLMLTLPFALYVILRYHHLIYSGSIIPLKTQKFYTDLRLCLGVFLWVLTTVGILYW